MMLPTVVALGAANAIRARHPDARWWVFPAVVIAALSPLAAIAAAVAGLAMLRYQRLREARVVRCRAGHDAIVLAELTALGLTSGLSFLAALETAGVEVGPPLQDEVRIVVRRSRHIGIAPALEQAGGSARRLYVLAARATVTGAPVADAVRAYVVEQRDAARAHALATARRLPVRLLFPLTLLILPGFMVLTVAPALLGALERLGL